MVRDFVDQWPGDERVALTGAVGDIKPVYLDVDDGSGYAVWDLT
jgi:hypothetical protein